MRADEPMEPVGSRSTSKTAAVINLLLGIWVLISPWVLGFARFRGQFWNDIAVGALIIILSYVQATNPVRHAGLGWVNFLLGIWLIISAWVFGLAFQPAYFWNQIILGIVVCIVSIWSTVSRPAVVPPAY